MGAADILIMTPGELTRDPRARRATAAARALGLSVTGLCLNGGEDPVALDGIIVRRIASRRVTVALRSVGLGGTRASSTLVRELRGVYRLVRLALESARLVAAAGRPLGVHTIHANDFDTLPAAWCIARRVRARLVYDAHELYTRQETDPPRIHRAIAGLLERTLARRADAVVTVSDAIAAELTHNLRLRRRPLVVLNCAPLADVPPPTRADTYHAPLRVVYQGATGPARPLDDLFEAAVEAPNVDLSVRVAGADMRRFQREVMRRGLDRRVHVLEAVAPTEVVSALTGFHVGLIINRPLTRNDELGFPNKLFEYMMAGLAVVAPALPGLVALVGEVGATFEPGSPEDLAAVLQQLAADPERVERLRRRAYALAREQYNAEAQRPAFAAAWGL